MDPRSGEKAPETAAWALSRVAAEMSRPAPGGSATEPHPVPELGPGEARPPPRLSGRVAPLADRSRLPGVPAREGPQEHQEQQQAADYGQQDDRRGVVAAVALGS